MPGEPRFALWLECFAIAVRMTKTDVTLPAATARLHYLQPTSAADQEARARGDRCLVIDARFAVSGQGRQDLLFCNRTTPLQPREQGWVFDLLSLSVQEGKICYF
ncbi:hypothetical protein GOBAR_DD05116 [Gossypium barbadense]|nr:hypothetical protein GOBAR_DD05116 [Gossypium barbadense]